MQTQQLLGKLRERIFISRALYGSIIALAVFILGFTFLPYLLLEANAETVATEVDWGSVFLTLDPDAEATATVIAEGGTKSDALNAAGHGDVSWFYHAYRSVRFQPWHNEGRQEDHQRRDHR